MKKLASILLTLTMVVALAGCSKTSGGTVGGTSGGVGYPDEDGYAEGRMGDTMHTYWFDFTVNSAFTCDEYEGYVPADGNQLLIAKVTVKNTFNESLPMFYTDFQAQWGDDDDDDAYAFPVEGSDSISDEFFADEYYLDVNGSESALLLYEVPAGNNDFSLSYLEYADNGTTGDTFFVFFTANHQ